MERARSFSTGIAAMNTQKRNYDNGSRQSISHDGIDRRNFLNCMRWAGTGLLWTIAGGVPTSRLLAQKHTAPDAGAFSFIQISDSHIGFSKRPIWM